MFFKKELKQFENVPFIRTRIECRRREFRMKRIFHSLVKYFMAPELPLREAILQDMHFPASFKKSLIVKSHPEELKPEFVASILGKHDEKVKVRDKWVSLESSPVKYWCGAVALYDCMQKAEMAAKELRILARSIKTIMFPEFFFALIETEVKYHSKIFEDCGSEATVVLRGNLSLLKNGHVRLLNKSLSQFGTINHMRFHYSYDPEGNNDNNIICQVQYEYTTPAILASTMMNGTSYSKLGFITAELEQTKKLRRFMEYVKGVLVEAMNNEDPFEILKKCDCICCKSKV